MNSRNGRGGRGRAWSAALLLCALAACDRGAAAADPEPGAEGTPATAVAMGPELPAGAATGASAEQVERGRELFAVCATCHGVDARGTALGPDLRDGEWIHISGEAAEIAAIVRAGVPEPEEFEIPMPVMGGGSFAAEEVDAVAAYVHALSRQTAGS